MDKENREVLLPDRVIEAIKNVAKTQNLININIDTVRGSSKGDNYSGDIVKVYVKSADKRCLRLIVKVSRNSKGNINTNIMYNKEVTAYSKILPSLRKYQKTLGNDALNFAKYFTGCSELKNEYVIMENLLEKGYKTFDRKKCFDATHFRLVVKSLARFHSASFALRKMDPDLYNELISLISCEISYGAVSDDLIIQNRNNLLSIVESMENRKKIENFLTNTGSKRDNYINPNVTAPFNVITHGDCWTGNMFFKYEKDIVIDSIFLDWQTVRVASPITDIVFMVFSCTDEKLRSKYFMNMLDYYYESLEGYLDKMGCDISVCYPREVYQEHLKKIMPFGLIVSTAILPPLLAEDGSLPDYENNDMEAWLMTPFSNLYRKRFNGVIRDFKKFGYL